jgi:hypothetical protein
MTQPGNIRVEIAQGAPGIDAARPECPDDQRQRPRTAGTEVEQLAGARIFECGSQFFDDDFGLVSDFEGAKEIGRGGVAKQRREPRLIVKLEEVEAPNRSAPTNLRGDWIRGW